MQTTTEDSNSCYVIYEKKNGLVGIQERTGTFEDLDEYLYAKDTAFKKTNEYRELDGKKAIVYVEIE